jgi:hypothetical protein
MLAASTQWPQPTFPVPDHLEADIADPGGIQALAAIINLRQVKQPAALARSFR